jgi:hypothetical protein
MEGLVEVARELGLGTIVGVALGWFLQEWSRRRQGSFEWREAHYGALMAALSAFYERPVTPGRSRPGTFEAREAFLEQYRRAWLFAPDEVLDAADEFLEAVRTDASVDEATRGRRAKAFVIAKRKDLRGKTRRTAEDVQFWSAQ